MMRIQKLQTMDLNHIKVNDAFWGKYTGLVTKEIIPYQWKALNDEVEDAEPISFSRLLGKPVFCIPYIAVVSDFINSEFGVFGMAIVFALVLVMWVLADIIKKYHFRQMSK